MHWKFRFFQRRFHFSRIQKILNFDPENWTQLNALPNSDWAISILSISCEVIQKEKNRFRVSELFVCKYERKNAATTGIEVLLLCKFANGWPDHRVHLSNSIDFACARRRQRWHIHMLYVYIFYWLLNLADLACISCSGCILGTQKEWFRFFEEISSFFSLKIDFNFICATQKRISVYFTTKMMK